MGSNNEKQYFEIEGVFRSSSERYAEIIVVDNNGNVYKGALILQEHRK